MLTPCTSALTGPVALQPAMLPPQAPALQQELAQVRQRIVAGKRKLEALEAELQDLAKRTAAARSELDAEEQREQQLLAALAGGRRRRLALAAAARTCRHGKQPAFGWRGCGMLTLNTLP